MNEFCALLDRYWITREQDRELYYQLKRSQPEYRKFLNERLGWNLFVNEAVVKLEKTPPKAAPWMGLPGFKDTLDYCLLCALLLFLSDLDDGEQFLLSTLTASVQSYLADLRSVDWTRTPDRRSLVRVLQFATGGDIRLLLEFDGRSRDFERNQEQEVLYENTGLSRHFPTHFGRDILSCRTPEDFENLLREAEDSRRQRVHRIYQQFALCPAFYRSQGEDGDYEYIKNQAATLERHLGEALGESGELHVHRAGAFFALDETDSFGEVYPGRQRAAVQDLMLLLCGQLRAKAGTAFLVEPDDSLRMSREAFCGEVELCRSQWSEGWGKILRELSLDALCQTLMDEMRGWMLLDVQGEDLILLPAAGKWTGRYPASFHGSETDHDEGENREPTENNRKEREKPDPKRKQQPEQENRDLREPVVQKWAKQRTLEQQTVEQEPMKKEWKTEEATRQEDTKEAETGRALENAQIGLSEFLAL